MKRSGKLSRRQMLQYTGVGMLGAGALIAGVGCSSNSDSSNDANASTSSGMVKLTVYDPCGSVLVTESFTDRLDTLDGKTIAFVGDGMWEDDRTFAVIKEKLESNYSDVTVITEDNFPQTVDSISVDDNGIAEKMLELGVDAAIIGNAG